MMSAGNCSMMSGESEYHVCFSGSVEEGEVVCTESSGKTS